MAKYKSITGKVTEPLTPTHHKIPSVTTANRPGADGGINAHIPVVAGMLIFNTTIGTLQQLTSTGPNVWVSIDSPPIVTSISPTTLHTTGQAFTITGSNFSSTISAVAFIGANDVSVAAASFSRVSATSITGTSPVLPVAQEPYGVRVTNATDLYATLDDAVDAGGSPTWTAFLAGLTGTGQATSGLIASILDTITGTHDTLAAVDPDGAAVTYAATGSGVWAGRNIAIASNGAVTGDPTNESAAATTYTQAVRATDSGGNTTDQNLQIMVIAAPAVTGSFVSAAQTYSGYKAYYFGSASTSTAISSSTFVAYGNTLVDIFMVAGGAAGSSRHGGGGGAGGAIKATGVLLPAGTLTIAGGSGASQTTDNAATGLSGGDLTIAGISGGTWTSRGGGGGAPHGNPGNASAGGCGGGAGLPSTANNTHSGGAATQASYTPSFGGSTITVHGYAGAALNGTNNNQSGGGGGGGCGGLGLGGFDGTSTDQAGIGGLGISNDFITGANGNTIATHLFGGGGGGGGHGFDGTPPAHYGGGAGSASGNFSGGVGINFAGGGGGGGGGNITTGGSGGNGICIIRHAN